MTRGVGMQAIAMVLVLAGASSTQAEPGRAIFLALLHDGRFEAAQATLMRGGATRPDDLFFYAFTTYWRLVFDDDNPELRATLDVQLNTAIVAAEELSDARADGDAALWGGSSHLLLASLRASQRHPLAAAFEAKKAKRLLESASIAGADTSDAQFGLGTYNYLADVVPSYVKGLRALLLLPKGDRALGLRQLAAAAAGSRSFALEARTLLITIYANSRERLYGLAIEQRDRLLQGSPESIAASYAASRLDLSLGRNEASLAQLARAEERARILGDVDPVVLRSIDLLRARAELAALRPDRAEATTQRALAAGRGLGIKIRQDLEAVRKTASRQADGIAWSQLAEVNAPADQDAVFRALATAYPDRPLLALLAGDADLRAGRPHEASDWFDRAVNAGLPSELKAGCLLRQGQAADLLGQRARALGTYKRAAATPGFVAKDAALYYQQTPYRLDP